MSHVPPSTLSFTRALKLTVEVLRQAPIAEALSRDLSTLARTYKDCPEEAIFVRIPFTGGHVDGWYRPAHQEFEPTDLCKSAEIA